MPEWLQIHEGFEQETVERAVAVLRRGGVIVLPTETLYGLAANALRAPAVARIFEIKFRSQASPLPLIFASREQVAEYCVLDNLATELATTYWPGPLTLVLKGQPRLGTHLLAADGTVAVRVSSHAFCRALAEQLAAPITATSANISGRPAALTAEAIDRRLQEQVEMIIDGGPCRQSKPSTILRIAGERIEVVRSGVIAASEIKKRIGVDVVERQ